LLLSYLIVGFMLGVGGLIVGSSADGENPLTLFRYPTIWLGLVEWAVAWPVFLALYFLPARRNL
jgi:hypothetical protein